MPEDKPTGQAESKQPEPKPVEKPSPSEEQGKAGGRRFVKYQDLSKEDLVRMLMRINKRLSRISRELREVTDILYYGYTQGAPQSEGQENQGYRNYRRNYSGNRQYGRYGNRQYKRRSEDEDEDVDYD
jgi:hypothetical protein